MRFVLCDDDQLFTSMVEAMLNDLGHEVVGVGTNTADCVALVETSHPDVVIVDLSLGFNTDFDVITSAIDMGATAIIFSQNADEAIVKQYPVRPLVVFKPDLTELERVVSRLTVDTQKRVTEEDRRRRPARAAAGPAPTSPIDAQAFYEALNAAQPGDALLSIELPSDGGHAWDANDLAARVRVVMRETDRLLASVATVRVFLPGGDEIGAMSLRNRLAAVDAVQQGMTVRSVVIAPGEAPADAFDRLKFAEPQGY